VWQRILGVLSNVIYCIVGNLTLSSSERILKIRWDLTKLSSQ